MKLIFSPTSLSDLQRINQFYTAIDVKIMRQAIARLKESIQAILKFPHIGRLYLQKKSVHEFIVPFGKGNFTIRYHVSKTRVSILHIWHSLEDE